MPRSLFLAELVVRNAHSKSSISSSAFEICFLSFFFTPSRSRRVGNMVVLKVFFQFYTILVILCIGALSSGNFFSDTTY